SVNLFEIVVQDIFPRYLSKNPDDARAHLNYAIELLRSGRNPEALVEAAKANELTSDDPVMMYNTACFYSRLGENELAVKMLNTAIDNGFEHYEWLKRDTDLDNIRNDPGYIQLMKGK